ncbi:MAG: hypothetical protein SWZ49_05550 [Cyanobacteriota bacterium]|nr:hypothetical protein [Cyanobacteriota bacterium]
MSAIKTRDYGGKEYISKIVKEYGKLIRIRFPSDVENDRILEIMEIAVENPELDNLINQEDKNYAEQNNLLEDDYIYSKSLNSELDKSQLLSVVENKNNLVLFPRSVNACSSNLEKRKSLSFDIRNAIPCIVAAGILTCVGIGQFCNSLNQQKETSAKYASAFQGEFYEGFSVNNAGNYFLSNANNTEIDMSICNSNNGKTNKEMKNYYISFKNLKNQILTKKLQPSQAKGEVRKLQVTAEIQQREAEKNQRYLENQKELAEVQHNYDEAQSLKNQAKTALSESQQWLCLSQQALNLSIR